MNFYAVKSNFLRGLWNINMVNIAKKKGIINIDEWKEILHDGVEAGIITEEQYKSITGENFSV